MKSKLYTVLFFLIACLVSLAQEFNAAKLNRYFDALETNQKFMGSVAVMQEGKILYSRSVGYADVENHLKANENTKYRIGSITKTFTSVLVMKAVEDNKLSLDQTIDAYFPGIPNAGKITVRQLLSHRSGIHNFTSDETYLTWNTEPKTEADMIEIITRAGSDFEPDSKAEYSNSNFVLLTFILEKSFQKPYAELLAEKIVNPLGLTNTRFGGKVNTGNNECKSYSYRGTWKEETETDMSIPLGAGSIVSTPTDLVKFSEGLFSGRLFKQESLELMKTARDRFGFGLFIVPFYDKSSYGHTGGIDGFSSVFTHFVEDGVSYALISNGANYNTNNISIAVLSAVFNKPYEIPEFATSSLNPEDLNKYPGVYASTQLPLKLTITIENNMLIAQGTGQPSFPLEATGKDTFQFEQAGVVMEFQPSENTLVLKQGGGEYVFTKE